ncbi:MAG: AbrB/MazE/SpoVT family DNA-binding domain-containing protein [bacterium]|nr:AbrB/MazE/SpoVT family DNA-binding domain-containing protein [bacterium]
MIYTSTITKKGQITIPLVLRDIFGLKEGAKVFFEAQNDKKAIILKPKKSIFDLAGTFQPSKVENILKVREKMLGSVVPR